MTDKDNKNKGDVVDQLINKRDNAQVNLVKSQADLLDMGVKTVEADELHHLPGLDVEQFMEWGKQEYSWYAEHGDGVINQFEKERQHHYGDIEQENLKKFCWVSCFDWQTDQDEKRVIVELNFENGEFTFTNGLVSPDARQAAYEYAINMPKDVEDKTLTMKIIHRESSTSEFPSGNVTKISLYNRFLIGMKADDHEIVLCLEPNGKIHLW
jgi:hypothetical protein